MSSAPALAYPQPTNHAMADDSPTHALLKKAFPIPKALSIFTDKLNHKPLFLHANPNTPPTGRELRRQERLKKKDHQPNRKPKPLTARQKRALRIHEIPPEAEKYALYEPLHELWIGYMQEVLQIDPETAGGGGGGGRGGGVGMGQAQIGLKLASADYHGAVFEVVRSRCPSRVGIKGICVKETRSMFYIITRGNKIKEMPKEHTVFRFELPVEKLVPGNDGASGVKPANDAIPKPRSMVFELHGSQFMYRAAERAGRKFKQKPGTDL